MSLKRTLAILAAGGLITVAGAGAASARTLAPAVQQVATTASNSTRVCGPIGEVNRPFRGDGSLILQGPAVVVQTGISPASGPGIPASQLTGATSQGGFRFRVFDQTGAAISNATPCVEVYYHASTRMQDGSRTADLAQVQTDGAGYAQVRFAVPMDTAPVSVTATGSSPYRGPGLPLHLVADGYTSTGFRVRVLDQTGAPVANQTIRLHYWATVQSATPNTRAGNQVVNPDGSGVTRVRWPLVSGNLPPVSVMLTGVSPTTGPDLPASLVAFSTDTGGVNLRALDQTGEPVTTPFRVAFYATWRSVS